MSYSITSYIKDMNQWTLSELEEIRHAHRKDQIKQFYRNKINQELQENKKITKQKANKFTDYINHDKDIARETFTRQLLKEGNLEAYSVFNAYSQAIEKSKTMFNLIDAEIQLYQTLSQLKIAHRDNIKQLLTNTISNDPETIDSLTEKLINIAEDSVNFNNNLEILIEDNKQQMTKLTQQLNNMKPNVLSKSFSFLYHIVSTPATLVYKIISTPVFLTGRIFNLLTFHQLESFFNILETFPEKIKNFPADYIKVISAAFSDETKINQYEKIQQHINQLTLQNDKLTQLIKDTNQFDIIDQYLFLLDQSLAEKNTVVSELQNDKLQINYSTHQSNNYNNNLNDTAIDFKLLNIKYNTDKKIAYDQFERLQNSYNQYKQFQVDLLQKKVNELLVNDKSFKKHYEFYINKISTIEKRYSQTLKAEQAVFDKKHTNKINQLTNAYQHDQDATKKQHQLIISQISKDTKYSSHEELEKTFNQLLNDLNSMQDYTAITTHAPKNTFSEIKDNQIFTPTIYLQRNIYRF